MRPALQYWTQIVNAKDSSKPTLAIISTYDAMCGIAAYTRKLVPQLEGDFDIEVFDLDQLFMRAKSGGVVKLADQQIRQICKKIEKFDYVNIQLEYGTLGHNKRDILRRLIWLLKAAPRIAVTFHTILEHKPFPVQDLRAAIFKFELYNSYRLIVDHLHNERFREKVYEKFRATQAKKPFAAIVHTWRDARQMHLFDRIATVVDHPLAFISAKNAVEIRQGSTFHDFPSLRDLPQDSVVMGVFGFLGLYKGMHVAIEALNFLPKNYHLAIFGGLHPQEITASSLPHPYVSQLMRQIHTDETELKALTSKESVVASANISGSEALDCMERPHGLSDRVHFMGSQSDRDLEKAVATVDLVLLPYFEVGQSSSGPMSLAVDLGAHIVASRNQAFMQFARYHPSRVSFFEVGNHLEMAQRVMEQKHHAGPVPSADHNTITNAAIYHSALTGGDLVDNLKSTKTAVKG
jgi:glycosyltransferase involved in cell wall biosynthesis